MINFLSVAVSSLFEDEECDHDHSTSLSRNNTAHDVPKDEESCHYNPGILHCC